MPRVLSVTILSFFLLVAEASWSSGYSFRYRDAEGKTHIGYSVPPQFVANGYEVLNETGRVVDIILPKDVLNERAQKLLQEAEARHKFELQRANDEALLRYYSAPEDVERVRQRRIDEIDNFIAIQKANILSYRSRIVALQHQAADLERAGKKVPADILSTLTTLEQNIAEAEQSIVARTEEKQKINTAFDKDIARLNYLLKIEKP